MKLTFSHAYKSITSFPDVDLPPLTVITGLNGSGKSHLLQGIDEGAITVNDPPIQPASIRLLDWRTLATKADTAFPTAMEAARLDRLADRADDVAEQAVNDLRRAIQRFGGECSTMRGARLRCITVDELEELLPEKSDAPRALEALHDVLRAQRSTIVGSPEPQQQLANAFGNLKFAEATLSDIEDRTGTTVLAVPRSALIRLGPPVLAVDLFHNRFGQLFANWRRAEEMNRKIRFLTTEYGEEYGDRDGYLDEEEFARTYGPPPWEVVNTFLAAAELDFQFAAPPSVLSGNYSPALIHSNGVEISFDDVSSGEQILLAISILMYQAGTGTGVRQLPKVLLLDEVDSPLHPSMIRQLISALRDALIEPFEVSVVLATHSPTTAAIAPNGSVYQMEKGVLGLKPIDSAQAVRSLTAGIPTLSVSIEERRPVYVESFTDVGRYEALMEVLSSEVDGPFEPQFLATGRRDAETGEERDTGVDRVISIVSDLRRTGMLDVYGLRDRDATDGTARDGVLCVGGAARDSIENFLLDPLLIGALMIHERLFGCLRPEDLGVPDGPTWASIDPRHDARLQQIADSVISEVDPTLLGHEMAEVKLQGGAAIALPTGFLDMDGHAWAAAVMEGLAELRRFRSPDVLMRRVIDSTLRSNPGLAPVDLVQTLDLLKSSTLGSERAA